MAAVGRSIGSVGSISFGHGLISAKPIVLASLKSISFALGHTTATGKVSAAARSLSMASARFGGSTVNAIFASLRSTSFAFGRVAASGKTVASARAASSSSGRVAPAPRVSAAIRSISASRGSVSGNLAVFVLASVRSISAATGRVVGAKFSLAAFRSESEASGRIIGVGGSRGFLRALSAAFGYLAAPPPVVLFADPRFVSPMQFRITASTLPVNMPQGPDFSLMDVGETITGTIDFSRWLPPGVTIASVVSVTAANVPSGTDSPYIRIIGNPMIGVAPWVTGGSGIAGTAVLQQWQGVAVGTVRATITILTSDGQTLSGWAHQMVGAPN